VLTSPWVSSLIGNLKPRHVLLGLTAFLIVSGTSVAITLDATLGGVVFDILGAVPELLGREAPSSWH
jgi:hypothetical protein